MDKHIKCAESLMRLGDEIIAERTRRRKMIMRSCAVGAGAAAVLGIGLTTFALRPPERPQPESSGIIVETTDMNTVTGSPEQTTAATVTTQKQTAPSAATTAEKTSTAAASGQQTETTAASTDENGGETSPAATTAAVTTEPATIRPRRDLPPSTWTEVEKSGIIKTASALLEPFDYDEQVREKDLVFDGIVLEAKEYNVEWYDDNGEKWGPYQCAVLTVRIREVYSGETDKDVIQVYYPMSLSVRLTGSPMVNEYSEYIFLAGAFDEEFIAERDANPHDRFEQERYADVYIGGSCYSLMAVNDGVVSGYKGYFNGNADLMSKTLSAEEIEERVPKEDRAGWFVYLEKPDAAEELRRIFN